MRAGVAQVLDSPGRAVEDFLADVDAATLADQHPALVGDPALVAEMRRSNRANFLFWAESIKRDPCGAVPPNPGPEPRIIARDLVRRGLDDSVLQAWRAGQNAAWRGWMKIAFALTTDAAELGELLDYSARSIFGYVDATTSLVTEQIGAERERLTTGSQAQRLETVTLLIEGSPIAAETAEHRLAYALGRTHVAAIVWSDHAEPDIAVLDLTVEELAAACGARRPLRVAASVGALWVWLPTDEITDIAAVQTVLDENEDVYVAIGSAAGGLEGFRRSHLEALAAQRLLIRSRGVRLACWEAVELVALASHDEARARAFVTRTLGALSDADGELQKTVRVYLHEQSNAARTASRMFTHRNTILSRIARAEQLLPKPLRNNSIEVAVALELAAWI